MTTGSEQALVTREILRPLVTPEEALSAWEQYQGLKEKIATSGDLVIIKGRNHPTKQFANKLSKFFGLSVSIVNNWKEDLEDGSFTWHIIARASASNNQFRDGDGHCHSGERNFTHIQHDVFATAVTRAKNRAIFELVGFGEVSAEELGRHDEPESQKAITKAKASPIPKGEIPPEDHKWPDRGKMMDYLVLEVKLTMPDILTFCGKGKITEVEPGEWWPQIREKLVIPRVNDAVR